jgi:hypothetical protein
MLETLLPLGWTALALGYRFRKYPEVKLQPNCLLTRKPLIFVEGPESLFYFGRYWNSIPHFLQEHGYEVQVIKLNSAGRRNIRSNRILPPNRPSQSKNHAGLAPSDWLAQMVQKGLLDSENAPTGHYFVDPAIYQILKDSALGSKKIKTLNNVKSTSSKGARWDWLLAPIELGHRVWLKRRLKIDFTLRQLGNTFDPRDIHQCFLKRAIELAEQDFLEG